MNSELFNYNLINNLFNKINDVMLHTVSDMNMSKYRLSLESHLYASVQ